MAVNYIANLKSTRMADVFARIDIGTAGTLEICTAAYAAVIASIALQKPSFSESGGVLTLLGVPLSVAASLAGTNTAAVARIKASNGDVVVNNLTVGVGSGDIQLNSLSITLAQTVSLTAGTITHSA
jgi:hypothetical protein